MHVMQKRFFFSLIMFVWGAFFASPARAQGEFSTSLVSKYVVGEKTTQVTQTFHLTNNFSTMYVTEYALEVGSNKVENIRASTTTNAPVEVKKTTHGGKTTINLTFTDKVIGKDQKREVTVTYDTPDIGIRSGQILEINIPRLANPQEFSHYQAMIVVPQKYGAPALASPKETSLEFLEGSVVANYVNVGQSTGISMLFGKQQIANFSLDYHLENPTNQRGFMTITLPPDTTYQRVYFDQIEPLPNEIHADEDGNWLATYTLEALEKMSVKVTGNAVITLTPNANATLISPRPDKIYLSPTPHWQSDDPQIIKLAQKLKTPRAIYDYVVGTLTYDYSRLTGTNSRPGALSALAKPTSAVCTEFTDLFIALARAAGIPAREVNGYAYTQNEALRPLSLARDVLHAWPEYWDEMTAHWVAVDPTWENTTGGVDYFSHLDFNHMVFAIHGIKSDQPYPAGEFKFNGQETKDITVTFVDTLPPSLDLVSAKVSLSPYAIELVNNSLHAIYNQPYTTTVYRGSQEIQKIPGTISLIPLGRAYVPLRLSAVHLVASQSYEVKTQINNQIFSDTINVKSFIQQHLVSIATISTVAGVFIVIAVITRSLLVPRRKR